jgi:hypothetical protein
VPSLSVRSAGYDLSGRVGSPNRGDAPNSTPDQDVCDWSPPPWCDQPEAAVLREALIASYRLTPGQALADLDPADFTARPEYGTILRAWRWQIDRDGLQPFDRDQLADALTAHGLPDTLADVAATVVEHGPLGFDLRRLARWMRTRADDYRSMLVLADRLGIIELNGQIPAEPPVKNPYTATVIPPFVPLPRIEKETRYEHTPKTDALDLCERIRAVWIQDDRDQLVIPVPCGLRTCRGSGCGGAVLDAIVAPIIAESGPIYMTTVTAAKRRALRVRIHRAGEHGKLIPHRDGTVTVFSTLDIGQEVAAEDLPDRIATAFWAVAPGHPIGTTGGTWEHAAPTADDETETTDRIVHGVVGVSHLRQIDAGTRLAAAPTNPARDAHRPEQLRVRVYRVPENVDLAATVEKLHREWKVTTPAEAREHALERRALHALDQATAGIIARHRAAA